MENPEELITCSFCEEYVACPECLNLNFFTPKYDWPGGDPMDKKICECCAKIENINSCNDEDDIRYNHDDFDIEEDESN